MILICIHCSLRAWVEGVPAPVLAQTIAEHMRTHHPDLQAMQVERTDLEKAAREKFALLHTTDHDL